MWTSRKTSESSPEKRIPETDHSVGGSATKTNSDPTEVEYTQKTMSTPNSRRLWTFLLLAFYLIDATGKKSMCVCSAYVSFWHLCLFCISLFGDFINFNYHILCRWIATHLIFDFRPSQACIHLEQIAYTCLQIICYTYSFILSGKILPVVGLLTQFKFLQEYKILFFKANVPLSLFNTQQNRHLKNTGYAIQIGQNQMHRVF